MKNFYNKLLHWISENNNILTLVLVIFTFVLVIKQQIIIDNLNKKITVNSPINRQNKIDRIIINIDDVNSNINNIESKIDDVESKIDDVESKINNLY